MDLEFHSPSNSSSLEIGKIRSQNILNVYNQFFGIQMDPIIATKQAARAAYKKRRDNSVIVCKMQIFS